MTILVIGREETLFLFLNAAENDKDVLNMKNEKNKSPIFLARTPKMLLMLSMQPEINCYDVRSKFDEKKSIAWNDVLAKSETLNGLNKLKQCWRHF